MNKIRTAKEVKESIFKGLDEAISISKKLNKHKQVSKNEEVMNINSQQSKKYICNPSPEKEMVRDKKSK